MPVSKAFVLALYERMATIRAFETLVKEEYLAGHLPGFVHLYIGEEASAVGVCAALERDDLIESTHRGHGHCIAKGADLDRMMAEIYGKRTGLCKGKGGSMHIADFSVGMLGANGVVGGGYNLAAGAAQHSQSVEAWVTHIPGLKVVAPSNAADAKALFKAAIRDSNLVIYFEHKNLFRQTFDVPAIEDEQPYEIGRARVVRQGSDVTLVSYSRTMQTVLKAGETLSAEGIEAEVIDLITLSPWDRETVLASVRKTGRLCICHEAVQQCGFGAEIAAVVAQEAFSALKAPIVRLGAPFTPVSFAPELEDQVRIHEADIVAAVRQLL